MHVINQLSRSRDYIDVLATFLPMIIAAAVAIIGFAQLRVAQAQRDVARSKLRLDLYNRRFEIMAAALDFYQWLPIWSEPGTDKTKRDEVHRRFIKAKNEAEFLFDPDGYVPALLGQMNDLAADVIGYDENRADLKSDLVLMREMLDARVSAIAVKWPAKFSQLKAAMAPYMNFHDL